MNKNILKIYNFLILCLLSLSFNIEAKRYWFNTHNEFNVDHFFDDMHNIHKHFKQSMKEFEKHMQELENSFSERAFDKVSEKDSVEQEKEKAKVVHAQKELESIKPEIKKDQEGNIEISFALNNVDKKSLQDIELQDGILIGQIDSVYGKVKFYISDDSIKLVRSLEINDEKNVDSDPEKVKNKYVYHYTYGSSNLYPLPTKVDINSVKAKVRDDNLIITLKPKHYTKIKVEQS